MSGVGDPGVLNLVWLVPALPLAGAFANVLFGKRLGRWAGLLATAAVTGSFCFAAAILAKLVSMPADSRLFVRTLWQWVPLGNLDVPVSLRVDPLSALMIITVTGVGAAIHLYSVGYMRGDSGRGRYFANLNLFAFSMLTLVLADNFLLLFVGWEMVGLCSYLLIGHWFERPAAAVAAKKAFVTNRIGDFGFLLGTILIFATFRSLNFDTVFAGAGALAAGTATAISLLLFLGATGKSAQIPLYVWLPDAMEGPTPVSALIHAATMVTAGVYMVARTHVIFEASPAALDVVAGIGIATALIAALIAIGQDDIKRVLAYSTISQLGYMFLGLGVGAYAGGIFHLFTHAFFKALLFLGAGAVMHALAGETDMKKMGGLVRRLPVTAATFMAGWLAISGIPPFAGFFSKDHILAAVYSHSRLLWVLGLAGAGLTAFYASRVVFLVFFGRSRVAAGLEPHEAPPTMRLPLVLLGIASLGAGLLGVSSGSGVIQRFLSPVLGASEEQVLAGASSGALYARESGVGRLAGWHLPGSGLSEAVLAGISVAVALVAIWLAYTIYLRSDWLALRKRFAFPQRVLANKFYVDEVYSFFTVTIAGALGAFFASVLDMKVIDGSFGALAGGVTSGAARLRRLQTGYVRSYGLAVLVGAVALVGVLVARAA
ncbi:MAG: NADH-quinone oxidoreductase subunit L [Actinomycetota bacterium]